MDLKTLLLTATALTLFNAAALALYWRARPTYPGFGLWAAGNGCIASGYVLLALRGVVPPLASILLGNLAFGLAAVTRLDAARRFLSRPPCHRAWYAVPVAMVAVLAVLTIVRDLLALRTLVLSLTVGALAAATGREFVRAPRRGLLEWAMAAQLFAVAAVIVARALIIMNTPGFQVFEPTFTNAGLYLTATVLESGWTLTFILLNGQRLNDELQASKQELGAKVLELQAALTQIKTLSAFLPMCVGCKKIRDEAGDWQHVDHYLRSHADTQISHGLCPDCATRLYPEDFPPAKE